MTTSSCVDGFGCDMSRCGDVGGGGGGGDVGGGGDGVGEWSGVMGFSKVHCGLMSGVMSVSSGVVVGGSSWVLGSMCSTVDCTSPIMSPSWLVCHVKVDVMCPKNVGWFLLPV